MKHLFKIMNFANNKKRVSIILFLSIIKTLIETVGISLMMPFVQMSMDFNKIHENEYYQRVYAFLGIKLETDFVVYFGVFLLLFFVLRTIYTVFYSYALAKFTKGLYVGVVDDLFHSHLGLSYRNFIDKNTSTMKQVITTEAQNSESFVRILINTFTDILTIIVVYSFLLFIDWKITVVFTVVLLLNIIMLKKTITPKIKKRGVITTDLNADIYKMLDEAFGNFKMIKLRGSEKVTENMFSRLTKKKARVSIVNGILYMIPKLFLELISFGLIISIIMYWIIEYQDDVSKFMGVLTVFFFAIYRLMPSVNRVIGSYNNLNFLKKSLDTVSEHILEIKEDLGDSKVEMKDMIEVKNLGFEYVKGKAILQDINLTIKKGENIAFIGPSGSGKSTIVDLLVGLHSSTNGTIKISDVTLDDSNKRSWRKQIGYIPQDIFLFDASVAENVAMLSAADLDVARVVEVLKQAHIYSFLEEHQEGIETIVGDKGVKLSGGQKQRIAIARALYHNPDVLVLDEATSALDTNTEKEIMKNIYEAGADKTLIIIAHRLSTIEECDTIYTLTNGSITDIKENK